MSAFIITIYANISGFQAFSLKSESGCSVNTETEAFYDGVERLMDSFGNAYVVYYDKDVYGFVHPSVLPSSARFRSGTYYIFLSIQYGYRVRQIWHVFEEISHEIEALAVSYQERFDQALFFNSDRLNAMVARYVEKDVNQPQYAFPGRKKSVVSYETPEQLHALLDNPIRPEFKELGQLVILQKADAAKSWISLQHQGYTAITDIKYEYQPFKLVYPDRHEEIVAGLEQEVDYECKMFGYQPYHFCGKPEDHLGDWLITLSEDKTTYTIGKSLEPLTKEYILVCKMDGKTCQMDGKRKPDSSFQTNIGRIVGNKLILTGQEIGQTPTLTLESPEYKIEGQEIADNEVIVNLKRRFYYNVKALLEDFAQKNPKQQNVSAQLKDTEGKCGISVLTNSQAQGYFDVPYTRAQLHFGETDDYQAWDCFADSDGKFPQTYGAAPKPKITVQFKIQNESLIQVAESGKLRGKCFYQIGNRLSEVDITDTTFVISDLPFDKIAFTLQVKGYKDYSQTKDYSKKASDKAAVEEIEVTLFPSPRKRIFFGVVTMAVSYLLGIFTFYAFPSLFDFNGACWKEDYIVRNVTSGEPSKAHIRETADDEQTKELIESRESIEEPLLLEEQPSANESDKVEIKAEKDKNEVSPVDSVRQQLLKKLKGMDFAQKDIKRLRRMKPSKEEQNLIVSCEKCLRLVNLPVKDKESLYNNGFTYKEHCLKLLPEHKTFMNEILFGKYREIYQSDNRQNYKTVNEALNQYRRILGE